MSLNSGPIGWIVIVLALLGVYFLSISIAAFTLLKTAGTLKKMNAEKVTKFTKYTSAVRLAVTFLVIIGTTMITLKCWNLYDMGLKSIGYLLVINYLMTCSLYLLGRVLPSRTVSAHPEAFFNRTYFLALLFGKLLYPCIWLWNKISLKLTVKARQEDLAPRTSWKTIIDIITHEKENGELNSGAFEMIEGVISMHGKMAREVMVARTDAFMIDIQNDNDRNIDAILQMPYSRVPIFNEDKDNILGVVHIKNLLRAARKDGFEHVTIRRVMRPALFIPETMTIDEVMLEMKKTQNQMAILFDEYGGVVGLVTLEDLLEEIVGEIEDESDHPNQIYHKVSDNEFIVQGKLALDDFNDEFGTTLRMNEVDTIAGYIIAQLGVIPDNGDQVEVETDEKVVLMPETIDDSRIKKVRVILPPSLVIAHVRKEKSLN
ncbi:hemolysin family protein [Liquorilactobacillus capillatus]|uniref:Hemolysin n=1 Tax=Liquorilactobacillus capillatus DSM 19910 TaxID=1423731 RepID=A0A0R1LXU8_9LACO|nr:hemolysin family protein [Liquorilactobacillus capillatus]KRL00257.1 hemolysin [Liquorilactobacillus capillatus DSM 19910]